MLSTFGILFLPLFLELPPKKSRTWLGNGVLDYNELPPFTLKI